MVIDNFSPCSGSDTHVSSPGVVRLREMRDVLRGLVESSEPAVVFCSLVELCVPGFSDRCHMVISETDSSLDSARRAWIPTDATKFDRGYDGLRGHSEQWSARSVIRTPFDALTLLNQRRFSGVIVHSWINGYRPTNVDSALAQFAVDFALSAVHRYRGLSASDPCSPAA